VVVKEEPVKMAPKKTDTDDENTGKVFSVSGPVIVAEDMIGCAMYELVGASITVQRVGTD